ncbi:hypothetical protein GC197_07965 [bacterium]|nr:hypothetical protein [bacterium]
MKMETFYGVYDNEADQIIAMVYAHAPLEAITNTFCPACETKMKVNFNEDGTRFNVTCSGEPLHLSIVQEIEVPPAWWRSCYEEPRDVTYYWLRMHAYREDGKLEMTISGWEANGTRWSGAMECSPGHPDYALWQWVLTDSGCNKDLISDKDLAELRAQFRDATKEY